MTLGPDAICYDPITRRPTKEFIREQARDHIAYGWGPGPGSTDRSNVWTPEDVALYMDEYRTAKKEQEAQNAQGY